MLVCRGVGVALLAGHQLRPRVGGGDVRRRCQEAMSIAVSCLHGMRWGLSHRSRGGRLNPACRLSGHAPSRRRLRARDRRRRSSAHFPRVRKGAYFRCDSHGGSAGAADSAENRGVGGSSPPLAISALKPGGGLGRRTLLVGPNPRESAGNQRYLRWRSPREIPADRLVSGLVVPLTLQFSIEASASSRVPLAAPNGSAGHRNARYSALRDSESSENGETAQGTLAPVGGSAN
jgi:hypothetical protein